MTVAIGSSGASNRLAKEVAKTRSLRGLVESMLPLAIRNEVEYKRMQGVVGALAAKSKLSASQERYLETLTILIEDFERQHHAIETRDIDPLATLHFLMEENGLSSRDIGKILGQPQLGSKILRGDRELSKDHIRKLSNHFQVSPSLFL